MDVQLLFRKSAVMHADLLRTLENIDREDIGIMERCKKSLMEIDAALQQIKSMVVRLEFPSAAEEVHFFREIKPLFVVEFIYRSKILEIEAARPNAGQHILKEYYESELRNLKAFVDDCSDFYSYYRRKATYMDEKYFVRRQFDITMGLDANRYSYDERFTTSHDGLVARIMANDRIEHYLLSAVACIEGYFFEKFSEKSPLTWTAPKSALVELLYALHLMHCFNGGSADLSETVKVIEKSFNIDLGNFYKTLHEVKSRKTGRTKFLQALDDTLNAHFENEDSLH